MNIYCLKDFKSQFEKLKKNNSYRDLQPEIISNFFGKDLKDFLTNGTRLRGPNDMPFLKKRISGRGGWRFYYLLIVKNENVYLMYLHPKKGAEGAENITEEFEKHIYNEVLNSIKSNDLYHVTEDSGQLVFKHNLVSQQDEVKMDELIKQEIPIPAESVNTEKKT